jgi:Protein of unknown function (DUF3618)
MTSGDGEEDRAPRHQTLATRPGDVNVTVDLTKYRRADQNSLAVSSLAGTEHAMADAEIEPRPADQETLVADIDATRAELARTIDAISDRVSPRRNVERAADQLQARLDENRRALLERVSQVDPIVVGAATAAVVVGVAILFLLRRRKR